MASPRSFAISNSRGSWHAIAIGALLWLAFPATNAVADEVSTGVFYRQDSDTTLVVSPRVAAAKYLQDKMTRVDVAYTADIWTSASIDIRTAATAAVTEQRNQVTGAVSHEFARTTVAANYYFSNENDYVANGAGLSLVQRLAGGNATLEERLNFGFDRVGRSGDPTFSRDLRTLGGRLAYTQNINSTTVLQGAYELIYREGYQASPYRFVGLGGDGLCGGSAVLCVPEVHPDTRMRHATVLEGRPSGSEDSSLGVGYRFYIDDWGVLSHTGIVQFAVVFGEESSFTFRYRFYTQGQASFYQPVYGVPGPTGFDFVSRDRELSSLFSNRGALAYDTLFELGESGTTLRAAIAAGLTVFTYNNFVGLDNVYSGDLTFALTLEL